MSEPNGIQQPGRGTGGQGDVAAVLCRIADDWLRRAGGWPRPEVREALVALALSEPDAAMECPYLLRLVATTPGVLPFDSRLSLRAVPAGETEMVGVTRAAELLGRQPNTIRWLARRGALPGASKQGRGRWLIPLAAIRNYQGSQRVA